MQPPLDVMAVSEVRRRKRTDEEIAQDYTAEAAADLHHRLMSKNKWAALGIEVNVTATIGGAVYAASVGGGGHLVGGASVTEQLARVRALLHERLPATYCTRGTPLPAV